MSTRWLVALCAVLLLAPVSAAIGEAPRWYLAAVCYLTGACTGMAWFLIRERLGW